MKCYGVFIGIDRYSDPNIRNLRYAKADAQRLYELFQKLRPSERELWLLTDAEATKRNIVKRVGEDVSRIAEENDIVFLYFSGHGSPETSGSIDQVSRYLIAHDTEYDSIFATGIDVDRELTRLFDRISAKLILMIIDACFSGRAGGRTFEGPNLAKQREKYRGDISLKNLDLGEGRIMLAASDDDQVALEKADLGHGVFTHFLINVLTDPIYGDTTIGITTLYDQIARQVRQYTHGRQTPILNGRSKYAHISMLISQGQVNLKEE